MSRERVLDVIAELRERWSLSFAATIGRYTGLLEIDAERVRCGRSRALRQNLAKGGTMMHSPWQRALA